MIKFTALHGKSGMLASAGVAALSLVAFAAPAYAQDADDADPIVGTPTSVDEEQVDASGQAANDGAIVVTGSRIRLPAAAESREPIVVLDEQYIEERNITNVADALNELPIYSGSVTPAGAQGSFGQGVNFLNTFGLGSNRNLTLINGRRFVNSNPPTVFNNAGAGTQVDLNVIPTILVDRIETVAVGGAPVYGSDAIASTTNVILKTRFDGIELSGTSGITERGDNFRYNLSAVAGVNLLDDTLNITASISHDEVNGLLANAREFNRDNIQVLENAAIDGGIADQNRVNPNFGADTGDTDGIPPFVRFRDTGIPYLSRGGVIFGGPLSLARAFDPNGNLIPYDPGEFLGGEISTVGGDGFRFSDFEQITSDLKRTSGNLFVTWEFTPNIEAYVEGTYFKSRADELVQQPTFNTVLFGGSSGGLAIRNDNPFLTDQARGVLAAAGVTQFTLSRVSLDLADPSGYGENEIKRGVAGIRGEFNGLGRTFNFDASYNRGSAEIVTFSQDLNSQNFINAVNVARDASGNIVCTTAKTRNGGSGFVAPGGTPIADAACVPLNLLGEGRASQAALDYVIQDSRAVATLDQEVFNANIGSTLFDLWGAGPAGFNIGYEHRKESGAFIPDDFQQQGLGRSVAIEPVSGSYNLDEVFGEVLVPLVSPSNNFFIHAAEVFGRVRYVDNTVNGGFTSWAAGGRISPIQDITIRGNFTRSFRAPAISELFSPQAGAFDTVAQPCENTGAGPNPTVRQTNCAAFLAQFPNANLDPSATATIPILVGGNPNLQNEEANAWTIGAVFQPRFLNRFVLAVDYVNIKISNPIIFLGAADLVAGCFDNPDFDTSDPANGNQFCSLIRRQPAGTIGTLPNGTQGDIGGFVIADPANPGVTTGFANGVSSKFEAIQGVLSYTVPNVFNSAGSFGISGNALWTLRREGNDLGVNTVRTDGVFGDPKFSAQLNLRYFTDTWGALWSTNFVGKQRATRDELSLDIREINERDPYALFNASVYFDPTDNMRFSLSVTNVFDRLFQNTYFGSPNGVADSLGRRFSASARVSF
jgi:outer membrane receptor protein involved in Fe transport